MSTVVGPAERLYLGTRQLTHMLTRMITCPPIHLFVQALTYDGKIDFSITTLEQLRPDPQTLADGLRLELDRLIAAVP